MKIINTKFIGLKIIKQDVYKDRRGYLRVTHDQKKIRKKILFLSTVQLQKKIHYGAFTFNTNINRQNMLVLLKEKY